MLGYSIYDKSINGVKTLTDGILQISNGNISGCNMFECNQMNVNHIDADNIDELSALVDSNTSSINTINNTTIPNLQSQITTNTDNIYSINNTSIPNLQSQINNNTNSINTLNNTTIPNLQTQITTNTNNINTINNTTIPNLQTQITTNTDNIYSINNTSIPNLQSQINNNTNSINTLNNTTILNLQSQITTNTNNINMLDATVIKTASVGTVSSLNNNQNATVSITKSGNNATFNFGIPKGKDGKSLTYKGDYDANGEYVINDIVKYNGDIYICILDNILFDSGNPDVSPDWALLFSEADITGQGFNWRGNWSSDKTFNFYDVALKFGSIYLCVSHTPVQSDIEPQDDTTNWRLFVARGEKGDKGDKGDNGSDSDFASVLGILGGVGVIFGAVALTGLAFANQFQNMKNKLGNISDELQNIGEEGNTDYRLAQLERKTKWQDAETTINNTFIKGDLMIQDALLNNNIVLNNDGTINATEINTTSINADNLSALNNVDLGQVNSNVNIFGNLKLSGDIKYSLDGINELSITKSELNQLNDTLAKDADVVKLTSDQNISGVKTFSNNIVASSNIELGGSIIYTEAGVSQEITKAELNQLNDTLAKDADVVKITGNQTVAGNKTLTGTTQIDAFASSTLITILKAVYPIGSIYINYNNTSNPNTIFGVNIGTWTQITGVFLRAHTSGGSTGGSSSHNHKWYDYNSGSTGAKTIDVNETSTGGRVHNSAGGLVAIPSGALVADYYTNMTDHLPPYLDVIMWRRTA